MEALLYFIMGACSSAAGVAFGMWRNRRRRHVEAALDDILADARRKFVPPPAPPTCKHHYRLKGLGMMHGWRGDGVAKHAGYGCIYCKKLHIVRAHRAPIQSDYVKPQYRRPV